MMLPSLPGQARKRFAGEQALANLLGPFARRIVLGDVDAAIGRRHLDQISRSVISVGDVNSLRC